ncbi:MAG: hypothetical protein QNK37_37890 [Acidobacteriota bacterium]|nr:hypothetical protein [Acidobacteriota bacterium]
MGLFASKVEKTLGKCKKKEIPLEVRYQDGNKAHPSKIIRVDKDKFLIEGFAETLREDGMEITVKELGVSFNTRVTHKTHDIRLGKLLYYCTFPTDLKPLAKRQERFFVYPRAVCAMSETSMEELIGDHDENVKTLKMYIWDITHEGLDLVNSKGHAFEPGHKFDSAKIKVGKVEAMASLQVTGEITKEYGKENLRIIQCKFASKIDNMEEFIDICRKIDSL